MNKKAVIFMPVFSIFVLVILTYAYYETVVKGSDDLSSKIGENQAEIINAYNKGQEYMLNAEYAIKYSSYRAIDDFIKYSGVDKNCNSIWKFNSDCNPDLKINFINLFNQELSKYNYKTKEVKIEDNNLIVTFEDFNYNKDSENFKVEYSLPVTVKQELSLDIEKLAAIKDSLKQCAQDGKDLNTCMNEKNEVQGNLQTFTIKNDKEIVIYTDKPEIKKQDFIFKIDTKDTGIIGVF